MKSSIKEKTQFRCLLMKSLDGTISKEETAVFNQLVFDFPDLEEYYFKCMDLHSALDGIQTLAEMSHLDVEVEQKNAFLSELGEYEKIAPTMEVLSAPEDKEWFPVKKISYAGSVRKINKFSLVTAVLGTAAFILMILYVRIVPNAPYQVATICDSIDAEWSAGLPISSGTRISSDSRPIQLTRGIMKLQTDSQVEITLEAPTEFYFSSDYNMVMNYGKLFAHVSRQGLGFTVATPNSRITDLGTEFGVLSQIDGTTEVHMFKGKANVFGGGKNQTKTSQILTAGSAVSVSRHNSTVQEISLDKGVVVRDIIGSENKLAWRGQTTLRFADLLLGGNGFGTASLPNIEYDPAAGTVVSSGVAGYRSGPGKRKAISQSPYLDSIFVPGSEDGDVIVSSLGHKFGECPETSGLYFANVLCQKNFLFFDPIQQVFKQSRQQFEDSGFLYLHSNVGLTIDLNAVRRAVPGLSVSSFSAFAGIIRTWNDTPDSSEADVWILVDGQVRSSRKALRADEGYDIHIDITDEDRFLTLIVTDGGKTYSEGFPANHYDTCGFAEPVFNLVLPSK